MKTKLPFLYLLLLFILGSCHTETEDFISKYCPGSCTIIKGRLTTDDRSKPLAGIMLEARYEEYSMFYSFKRRKAVTTTDANGNYELRFLMRDDEIRGEYGSDGSIVIVAHINPADYLTCLGAQTLQEYYDLQRDTTINLNYNLPKKAYVQLQVLNTQTIQDGDQISTAVIYDAGEAGVPSDCLSQIIWNKNFNAYLLEVAANQQIVIRTFKRKAGAETVTEQTITLKPGQTINYQVTF